MQGEKTKYHQGLHSREGRLGDWTPESAKEETPGDACPTGPPSYTPQKNGTPEIMLAFDLTQGLTWVAKDTSSNDLRS